MAGGCYLLWIDVGAPLSLSAGRLGWCSLAPGLHVYGGSAARGLEARVLRHLTRRRPPHQALRRRVSAALRRPARGVLGRSAPARGVASLLPSARGVLGRSAPARGVASLLPSARKRLHWHVDHLLERREARVVSVELFEEDATECGLIGALLASGASAPIPGFGASDCRSGCPAHLLRVEPDQRGVG